MTKITNEEIVAIYNAALDVSAGRTTKDEVCQTMNTRFGTNLGSVGMMIGGFQCLIEGTTYKRSQSEATVRYALTRIQSDYGTEGLRLGLKALHGHIDYFETLRRTNRKGLRSIHAEFLNSLEEVDRLQKLADVEEQFDVLHGEVRPLSDEELLLRAKEASTGPAEKIKATTITRQRNPYVKEFVLRRADGKCEADTCANPSPFRRTNGSIFLEVHHKIPLAEDGPDTVGNAVALCPNCHREAHFGSEKEKFLL